MVCQPKYFKRWPFGLRLALSVSTLVLPLYSNSKAPALCIRGVRDGAHAPPVVTSRLVTIPPHELFRFHLSRALLRRLAYDVS